jgi:hypothetical protein
VVVVVVMVVVVAVAGIPLLFHSMHIQQNHNLMNKRWKLFILNNQPFVTLECMVTRPK